jgi:hypothetical protein
MRFPKIQRALDAGLFMPELCKLPERPAPSDVDSLGASLRTLFSDDHRDLLLEWGGAHLDEIRIKAVEDVRVANDRVVFADDYNGFVYLYDASGVVFREDTDGGEIRRVAGSIREFIDDVFLGTKGVELYGEEWLDELRKHQIA